jgi:hypothetical protein
VEGFKNYGTFFLFVNGYHHENDHYGFCQHHEVCHRRYLKHRLSVYVVAIVILDSIHVFCVLTVLAGTVSALSDASRNAFFGRQATLVIGST